jgi:hypothetical protein
MRREQIHSWLQSVVVIGLLVIAYVTVWDPARDALMVTVVHPVLTYSAPPDSPATIDLREASGTVRIDLGGENPTGRVSPPAGIRFLLPAVFLILVASSRPYWFLFWGGHVFLAVCVLFWWVVAIRGGSVGAHIASFMEAYIVDAYSLVVPLVVLLGSSSASSKVPSTISSEVGTP